MPSINDQIARHNAQPQPTLTIKERAARFEQVCRDAASLEAARRTAGLPDPGARSLARVHLEIPRGADPPCPTPAVVRPPLPTSPLSLPDGSKRMTATTRWAAPSLACWAEPRGTIDVDVSYYLSVHEPRQTIDLLHKIGAEFSLADATRSLTEHGFCRVKFLGQVLDVFLPIASIYEAARLRRRRMSIGGHEAYVWDAETLCVFKMMFFRRKDLADVEAILRSQGPSLEREWVTQQLLTMYGERDPRISQWRELVAETEK